ncbi:hypothetical protein SBBP2_220027 [Burkholderiales bacterium]|nr:hypothetical protein SBBP2_220027 [Burkholderiales bacterium]
MPIVELSGIRCDILYPLLSGSGKHASAPAADLRGQRCRETRFWRSGRDSNPRPPA